MKYNRKAVIAAIIKIQKAKFEAEKKELEAREPSLADKVREAAANFVLSLSTKEASDSLKRPYHHLDILTEENRVLITLSINSDGKSKLFHALKDAHDKYKELNQKLHTINNYFGGYYRNGGTNLTEKVKAEVPYDYELQADELIKNPEFAADIETIRKQIFKD